jgi:FlaA1/EpsC-like NDP-sugar epimerase
VVRHLRRIVRIVHIMRVMMLAAVRLRADVLRNPMRWKCLADGAVVGLANVGAFLIRFEGDILPQYVPFVVYGVPVTIAMYVVAFLVLRTYRTVWRYAGVEDLWQLVKASVLGATLHTVSIFLLEWHGYPRSVMVFTAILTVLITGGLRLGVRRGRRVRFGLAGPERRVVIIGAGSTGEAVAREAARSRAVGYRLVGFVDDDSRLQGQSIHSIPVLGSIEDLPALAKTHGLQEAIVAIPRLAMGELRRIGDNCAESGLTFRSLPSLTQLVTGDGKLRYLRNMDLDSLLRRPRTSVDETSLRAYLEGKRVLVTGAGGSIGSELCRQVISLGVASLIMVERAESALYEIALEIEAKRATTALVTLLADVRDQARMSEVFERFRPQIVFHAAAYKHVPLLEANPTEAVLNNIVGTRRLARTAKRFDVERFVLISTDKVVRAKNVMGATKKISEMYVTALNEANGHRPGPGTRFRVVRFGNVLGSAGSVVPLFQRQVETGEPITITDPAVSRFFMTISEAVGLVLQSVTLESECDVFILDMGEPRRIVDVADDVVLSLGLPPGDVERRYVGLRPGEKMHESLWDDDEDVERSAHDGIFHLRGQPPPLAEVEALIVDLESRAVGGDVAGLLRKIQDVIPTCAPESSSGGSTPGCEPASP